MKNASWLFLSFLLLSSSVLARHPAYRMQAPAPKAANRDVDPSDEIAHAYPELEVAGSRSPASGGEKAPEKASVLWDRWYTINAAGNLPFGYYNDRFERKNGKIAFKNQFWSKNDGNVSEEQVVAIAANDDHLTPEFWNFHSSERGAILDVDGSFKSTSSSFMMTAKIRQNSKDLPVVSRSMPKKVFLSVMFPVWLGKRIPSMKSGQSYSFSTIFENRLDRRFAPLSGTIRLEKPDSFAASSKTSKIAVDIDGLKSTWYVKPTGEPIRIEMTSLKLVVTETTEAVARRHLMEKGKSN